MASSARDLRWRTGADLWAVDDVAAAKQALIAAAAGVGRVQGSAAAAQRDASGNLVRDASAERTARQVVADLDEMVATPGDAAAAVARFMASRPQYGETSTGQWSPDQVLEFRVGRQDAVNARLAELEQAVRAGYAELELVAERRVLGPTDNREGDEARWETLGLEKIVSDAIRAADIAVDDLDLRRVLQSPLADQWLRVNAPQDSGAFRREFRELLLSNLLRQQPDSPGALLRAETQKGDLLALASLAAGQEFSEKLVGRVDRVAGA